MTCYDIISFYRYCAIECNGTQIIVGVVERMLSNVKETKALLKRHGLYLTMTLFSDRMYEEKQKTSKSNRLTLKLSTSLKSKNPTRRITTASRNPRFQHHQQEVFKCSCQNGELSFYIRNEIISISNTHPKNYTYIRKS